MCNDGARGEIFVSLYCNRVLDILTLVSNNMSRQIHDALYNHSPTSCLARIKTFPFLLAETVTS